ncbi:MAG: tail fiber domain-containing protein [Saprospiraceae bacterium]|nr:tail fiber domain-containing protein [Saprospiraceae bacterium]
MKSLIQVVALFLIFSFTAQDVFAQTKLSVQGVIRKSDGNAVEDGEYAVTFNLYDTLTSGNLLWSETQSTLNVTSGIYSTILGEVNPLDLPFDQFYFLSLTIDGEELLPRAPLTTSPYANALIGFDNAFPSSGNVGIGTLNPSQKLDVQGKMNVQDTLFADDIHFTGYMVSPNENGIFRFEGTRIDINDPTGGTCSAQFSNGFDGENFEIGVDGTGPFLWNFGSGNIRFATSNSERMRLTNTGLGIGTSTPGYLLHVNGSAAKPGGGSWTNSSDRRLKKNINPFNDGLDVVRKMNPVTFYYNGKEGYSTEEQYVGIIAQEMEKIAPYMISEFTGKDDIEYLAFDPSALPFILVNAMQEQQAQIQELLSENTELKQKLKTQEEKTSAKLSVLEAKLNDIIEKQSLTKL